MVLTKRNPRSCYLCTLLTPVPLCAPSRYKLCEDLLSKSRHYDWKLRAIKTTLYVAGGMKRAAPELSEDKVQAISAPVFVSTHLILHLVSPAAQESAAMKG